MKDITLCKISNPVTRAEVKLAMFSGFKLIIESLRLRIFSLFA